VLERSPSRALREHRRKLERIRTARSRARRAQGFLVVSLTVRESQIIEALIRAQRLTIEAAADRGQVIAAIEHLLGDYAERWVSDT
jgi:hypothetical protein